MRLILCVTLLPMLTLAQHKSISYELMNEVGTYRLISLTFSHELDNSEGITYVIHKQDGDTVYQIDEFLNGWVALSNDGKTIAHLVSEKDKEALDHSLLTMFRDGKKFDAAQLDRLVHYELLSAKSRNRLPESGWLRNDSIYHQMASHPFYITDDKLFLSFDRPTLAVFDMNQMFHIYTGDGANHFRQNYYSLPNAPYRTEYTSKEYFPQGFPETEKNEVFADFLAAKLKLESAIPEEAKFRVEMELKLNADASIELRKSDVFSTKTNELDEKRTEGLTTALGELKLESSLLPPDHPAWIFSGNFWLK